MALRRGPLEHDHDIQVFSREEIEARRSAVFSELAAAGVDFVLLHTADNVFYVSGVPLLSEWGRPLWWVANVAKQDSEIIGSGIEKENMESSYFDRVHAYDDAVNVWDAAVAEAAAQAPRGAIRVGIELAHISVGLLEKLRAALPEAEFVSVDDVLASRRLIKSAEEFELLTIGGEVAKIGAQEFLSSFREGVTEAEVAARAVAAMDIAMSSLIPRGVTSTYSYCQVGRRSLTPHLHPGGRRIKKGDVVGMNVFPVISGYCVELERTFVYGEETAEQAQALRVATEAFHVGKDMVAPGVLMSEIDEVTRRMIAEAGLGEFIRHGTGHAHGIMIGASSREEGGELRTYNRHELRPGMALSVEPAVFLPDIGAFRHSDVMLVTEGGAHCITDFDVEIHMG